jgi:hypothetical protein
LGATAGFTLISFSTKGFFFLWSFGNKQ